MGDQDRSAELSQDQRAEVNARKKVAPQSGRPVTLRAVSSGDEEDLRRMFSRLSPRTIYQRFHMPYPRVPEWAVALFANANRYDGGSLFAFAGNEIAGHAMYVRSHSGQDAEMAIVVEDAWQSKGIGKLLVYELAEEARSQGIETFTGEILRENRRMLNLFNAAFAEVERARKGDSYLVRAPLRTLRLAVDPVRTLRHAA